MSEKPWKGWRGGFLAIGAASIIAFGLSGCEFTVRIRPPSREMPVVVSGPPAHGAKQLVPPCHDLPCDI